MDDSLRSALVSALEPEHLWIEDESSQHVGHAGARGGSSHYFVRIVSSRFAGQPLVERHRMVYRAVGDRVGRQLHALRLQALTPEEWHSRHSEPRSCTCCVCTREPQPKHVNLQ